jgi:pyrroline-5-carboxylate reductase
VLGDTFVTESQFTGLNKIRSHHGSVDLPPHNHLFVLSLIMNHYYSYQQHCYKPLFSCCPLTFIALFLVSTTNTFAMTLSVGFIGSGMMASAMMDGLINKQVCQPQDMICSDRYEPSLATAKAKGIQTTTDNLQVCTVAKDAIILAVKPHIVPLVCANVMNAPESKALIISIAAGVDIHALQEYLPGRRVVRVMPNTPCLVGEGAAGYSMGSHCVPEDCKVVETIFGSFGIALELDEILLNAVTGVSGSGPAYVFQFIEALADGGVRCGLTRPVALQLAAQTVKGAAEMVLQTNTNPAVLKDQVCSAGGTTIAAVDALEQGGLRGTVIQAVKAATKRSMQMGGIPEQDIRVKYNLDD